MPGEKRRDRKACKNKHMLVYTEYAERQTGESNGKIDRKRKNRS